MPAASPRFFLIVALRTLPRRGTANRALAATVMLLFCAGCVAAAAEPPPGGADQPLLRTIASSVDPAELRSTIEKLVGFGTRHTMSDTVSPTRGIGAARRWVQARFAAIGAQCGGCLEIVTPTETVGGARLPRPTEIVNVVAIQRGTSDPERVILITGHIDSRVTDVMNFEADAPGANDDASGVAAVVEAARLLSRHRFRATLVYGVLSGEEQGLFGGKILAAYAKQRGWQVEADLNNDIIGNSRGGDGVQDNTMVRVFSEGTKATETPAQADRRRYNGGEVDAPSRNLARYVAALAERYVVNLRVEMVYRTDRFGRGADQVAFLEAGYPALRFVEGHEDYTRQHQDVRVESGVAYGDTIDGIDFGYLAQITRLNLVAMAAMANAPAPPRNVAIEGAVSSDTTLTWQLSAGAAGYRLWWRRTTDPQWRFSRFVAADGAGTSKTVLKNLIIDDWFFGVAAVSADGNESPVVFPGVAGAY